MSSISPAGGICVCVPVIHEASSHPILISHDLTGGNPKSSRHNIDNAYPRISISVLDVILRADTGLYIVLYMVHTQSSKHYKVYKEYTMLSHVTIMTLMYWFFRWIVQLITKYGISGPPSGCSRNESANTVMVWHDDHHVLQTISFHDIIPAILPVCKAACHL